MIFIVEILVQKIVRSYRISLGAQFPQNPLQRKFLIVLSTVDSTGTTYSTSTVTVYPVRVLPSFEYAVRVYTDTMYESPIRVDALIIGYQ